MEPLIATAVIPASSSRASSIVLGGDELREHEELDVWVLLRLPQLAEEGEEGAEPSRPRRLWQPRAPIAGVQLSSTRSVSHAGPRASASARVLLLTGQLGPIRVEVSRTALN